MDDGRAVAGQDRRSSRDDVAIAVGCGVTLISLPEG